MLGAAWYARVGTVGAQRAARWPGRSVGTLAVLTVLSWLGLTAWLLIDLDAIQAGQRWWSFLAVELAVGVVLFTGVTVPALAEIGRAAARQDAARCSARWAAATR